MSWRLRDDLHWCVSGGRPIFLDVEDDRYFCLAPAAEPAFTRLVSGCPQPLDRATFEELAADGLLIDDPQGTSDRSASLIPPAKSDLLLKSHSLSASATVQVLIGEILTTWWLRASTLKRVIDRCSRAGGARQPCSAEELCRLAAAAGNASLLLRAADRCLVRALTIHRLCRRRGIDSKLVFGVRTNPFGAHAWTQVGDQVVVGEFEQVRLYTPIAIFG